MAICESKELSRGTVTHGKRASGIQQPRHPDQIPPPNTLAGYVGHLVLSSGRPPRQIGVKREAGAATLIPPFKRGRLRHTKTAIRIFQGTKIQHRALSTLAGYMGHLVFSSGRHPAPEDSHKPSRHVTISVPGRTTPACTEPHPVSE